MDESDPAGRDQARTLISEWGIGLLLLPLVLLVVVLTKGKALWDRLAARLRADKSRQD